MLSVYQISVPLFEQLLTALLENLKKAEDYCSDNEVDPQKLLQGRLATDMMTLIEQVQRATHHAVQAGSKLTNTEMPNFGIKDNSFSDLDKRIRLTVDYLNTLNPNQLENCEEKEVDIETRLGILRFKGRCFLIEFALPQFLFHVTTAYDIIRNAGVNVGKRDFLGNHSGYYVSRFD